MSFGRVLVALVLAVLFLFFPNRPVQFFSALVLVSGFGAWLHSRFLRQGISVRRVVHELRVARFEELEIVLILENHSFLPSHACLVADAPGTLSTDGGERRLVPLRGHERVVIAYKVTGSERGEYRVGPVRLQSRDPLGLFPFDLSVEDYCSVVVYPARRRVRFHPGEGIPQGALPVANPAYEDLTRYRSVREYVGGDELRRINWKASARLRKLCTNEYQFTLNCPFFVFLNLCLDDYPVRMRYAFAEEAIETAAALSLLATKMGQPFGFASSGVVPGVEENASFPALPILQNGLERNVAFPALPILQNGLERNVAFPALPILQNGLERNVAFPALPILQDQGGAVLDTLARIACRPGRLAEFGFLERLPYGLPSGSRFFYVGPEPRGEGLLPLMALRSSGINLEAFLTEGSGVSGEEEASAEATDPSAGAGTIEGMAAIGVAMHRISGEGHVEG